MEAAINQYPKHWARVRVCMSECVRRPLRRVNADRQEVGNFTLLGWLVVSLFP